MAKLDHTPWRPGFLAADVCPQLPLGIPQGTIMHMLERARAKGMRVEPLASMDVAVSIADDAIEHMIVLTRINR